MAHKPSTTIVLKAYSITGGFMGVRAVQPLRAPTVQEGPHMILKKKSVKHYDGKIVK